VKSVADYKRNLQLLYLKFQLVRESGGLERRDRSGVPKLSFQYEHWEQRDAGRPRRERKMNTLRFKGTGYRT
jgi:hypothetical protein